MGKGFGGTAIVTTAERIESKQIVAALTVDVDRH